MNNFNTRQIAVYGLLILLSLVVVFHVLIILSIIPFDMVWGGRLQDPSQMLSFEAFSIAINLLMLGVVGAYAGIVKVQISRKILRYVLWMMFGLFLLNTLGNVCSHNVLEKTVFTPLTILLALFCLRLAISKGEGLTRP